MTRSGQLVAADDLSDETGCEEEDFFGSIQQADRCLSGCVWLWSSAL